MLRRRVCIIIPVYNNASTIASVIEGVRCYAKNIIVVNDGSTDKTPEILEALKVEHITLPANKGKGAALALGFKEALWQGYDYAITIDGDGQHSPADIPAFLQAIENQPNSLIVGSRFVCNKPKLSLASGFANKFSNFWFFCQTGRLLSDTQTGFRAYPLSSIKPLLPLLTAKYEAELELLVFASFKGLKISTIPIKVYYPPKEKRVSHFRPGRDFLRISALNTALCLFSWGVMLPFKILKFLFCVAVLLLTAVVAFILEIAIFLYFVSHKPSEKERVSYHKLLQFGAKAILFSLPRLKTHIHNPFGENFTKPAVIIANHQSLIDLFYIISLTPKMVIVTKKWVWRNPFCGLPIRYAEYLPVDIAFDKAVEKLRNVSQRGYSIMIFPEGTRSANLQVGHFYQGAFYIARLFEMDILPIVFHGTGYALRKNTFRIKGARIDIEICKRVGAEELRDTKPIATAKKFQEQYKNRVSIEYDI